MIEYGRKIETIELLIPFETHYWKIFINLLVIAGF